MDAWAAAWDPERRYAEIPVPRSPLPFSLGVNLPWHRYGGDFGGNAWGETGLAGRDVVGIQRALDRARKSGAEVVRWFVLCDGRAGIAYDEIGHPIGLQPTVIADFERALDLAHQAGLRLVPVLFDFLWAAPARQVNDVQLGGRAWILRDPLARHALAVRVLAPLLAHLGHDDRIAMWELCNEPEWIVQPRWRLSARLGSHHLRRWLAELATHVRRGSPHPITVGLASARGLSLLRDIDVDMLQVHWYDRHQRRAPLEHCPRLIGRHRPVILGEFPSAGSQRTPLEILATAHAAGYSAAWGWSLLAHDTASDEDALLDAMRTFHST